MFKIRSFFTIISYRFLFMVVVIFKIAVSFVYFSQLYEQDRPILIRDPDYTTWKDKLFKTKLTFMCSVSMKVLVT